MAPAGEQPICTATVFNSTDCNIVRPTRDAFCAGGAAECQRYDVIYGVYDKMKKGWSKALTDAQVDTDSLIFNTFIFCQVPCIVGQ